MKEVLTYEEIRSIQRAEKLKQELQKIDESFFEKVGGYIKDKIEMLETAKGETTRFAERAKEKIENELSNIKKITHDLYERREHKLLSYALSFVRTNKEFHDTTKMLPREERLYQEIVKTLEKYRNDLLYPITIGKSPNKGKKTKMLRVISKISQFVWGNGKVYGPFEKEDIVNLPNEIADLLIKKEKVMPIENT